jgi:hypothetical protein
MPRLKLIVFALSMVTGLISGARAQVPVSTGTSNVTIVPNDGNTIVLHHSPNYGIEGSALERFSGSAAKIPTNFSGIQTSVRALSEPGYEVNVCISMTSEMVSRDGSGGKLRGDVYLVDSRGGSSNRTSAQQSGSDGEMKFFLSAMSPDASSMKNGTFDGNIDVVLTYN